MSFENLLSPSPTGSEFSIAFTCKLSGFPLNPTAGDPQVSALSSSIALSPHQAALVFCLHHPSFYSFFGSSFFILHCLTCFSFIYTVLSSCTPVCALFHIFHNFKLEATSKLLFFTLSAMVYIRESHAMNCVCVYRLCPAH